MRCSDKNGETATHKKHVATREIQLTLGPKAALNIK